DLNMQLSPNPTSGAAQLTFGAPYSGSLLVTDQFGRMVLRQNIKAQTAVQLEAAELPNGLYWIHAVSPAGEQKVLKMVIVH
ncbi:MAG: T9SS type A sorting domain-containing protein, partial [Saprospiraceae bacterium]